MQKKIAAMLLCLILMVAANAISVSAAESTAYTYTVSVDGKWIRTQDAYMPASIYLKGMGLANPNDLFLFNGKLYVTDTDNGRMAVYSLADGSLSFFGEGVLQAPKGVFVTEDGSVYVADSAKEAVVIFSPDKKVKKIIGRPNSYLFSSSSRFNPKNVVVSSEGNIFVIGDGAYEGIMQFDQNGVFQGYFAANKYHLTMADRFQDLVLNNKQKEQLLSRTPRPIQNIDISNRDLIYTVTQSAAKSSAVYGETQTDNSIKLLNMAGVNILSTGKLMTDEWNFVDVAAGPYGNMFALTYTGLIDEYDSEGNLVFSFGGRATSCDRNGLFTNASAITVDQKTGFLYVLDKDRALVQVFYPTDFAVLTHKAIYNLENGNYVQSESIWADLLRLNGMSHIAHVGYGKALFYQQKFGEALSQFQIANEAGYYSDTFWEMRSAWLNQHMPYILMGILLLTVVYIIRKFVRKKQKVTVSGMVLEQGYMNEPKMKGYLLQVLYLRKMLRHPLDGYYYLKREETGSVVSATMVYLLAFIVYMLDTLGRGFIFKLIDAGETNPITMTVMFFAPLILWILGSYMVSAINEGEGSLRNVYVATAYALSPYVIITPAVILLTYLLTQNEAFIVQLGWLVTLIWTGSLLFLSVAEIHQYSFRETIKNILLTLFFMIMVVVTLAILYLLWGQAITFFKEICGEWLYRVQN